MAIHARAQQNDRRTTVIRIEMLRRSIAWPPYTPLEAARSITSSVVLGGSFS
jgi:hypothetical protein